MALALQNKLKSNTYIQFVNDFFLEQTKEQKSCCSIKSKQNSNFLNTLNAHFKRKDNK